MMKDRQTRSVSARLTPLRCITGVLALVLACCSALCIYVYMTPAHASFGGQLATGTTMNAQAPMNETETETETPWTPTRTTTPAPSPSATRATTPTATATRLVTVTPRPSSISSSKGANSQTPVQVNVATGGQQTPVASPVPTNRQNNQASQGTNSSGNAFPIVPLCIGLASLIMLGLLLLRGRGILGRPAQALRSPIAPLAGSVSGSRQRKRRQDSFIGQRAFDLSSSWGGTLTRDELEQVMQQRRVANSIPPLSPQGGAAKAVLLAGETASVSFYGYPGVSRPGEFIAPDGSQLTVAQVPVLPATPPVPGLQAPPSNGPTTDSLGLHEGDPSTQAMVQTYVY